MLEEASWLAFPLYSLLGVDFSLNQWFLTGGDFSSTRQHRPTLPFGNIWDFFFLKIIYLFILASLGLLAAPRLSPVVVSRSYSLLVCGFLVVVVPLVANHGLSGM